MAHYAVQLATRYDGLVIATFPDLPGVSALGRDDEEALAEARRELDAALQAYAAEGEVAPEPRTRGATMIEASNLVPLAAE
jgi:predicted RNase H-like HicB family nuclease